MKTGTAVHFGEFLESLRKRARLTLRDFCKAAGADPGNISKIERGVMRPPQGEDILARYAKALGVQKGSDDWHCLCDYAAADQGLIPQDLMADEEVVKMLPAFFRTLRGQKPTEAEMRELVEKIRRS